MWELFGLGIIIVAGIILISLFFVPAIIVALNLTILYLLFVRISTEIRKYKRGEYFAIGAVAGLIVILLVPMPLWHITDWAIVTYVVATLWRLIERHN